jgi:excisionase family DNA binding protein
MGEGDMAEKLYSTRRTAQLLGVSVRTVRRWCQTRKIKALKTVGGWWRIPESEINRLLREARPESKLESLLNELIDRLSRCGYVIIKKNYVGLDMCALDVIEEFNRMHRTGFTPGDVLRALCNRL